LDNCTGFHVPFQGRRKADGSFDWKNALIDSAIVAGVDFFTTLGGLGVAGLFADPTKGLIAAGISAAAGFFFTLAVKRGVISKP
jgi:hypothetical protein